MIAPLSPVTLAALRLPHLQGPPPAHWLDLSRGGWDLDKMSAEELADAIGVPVATAADIIALSARWRPRPILDYRGMEVCGP